jgi:hypothetical protein
MAVELRLNFFVARVRAARDCSGHVFARCHFLDRSEEVECGR